MFHTISAALPIVTPLRPANRSNDRVVGINTTLAIFVTPLYDFGLLQIGYFYFTPVVAATLGEIAGHWLHDAIARFMTNRSKEKKLEPEYRLMV